MTGALDDLRDLAKDLIDDFGKPVTVVRESQTYDPTTGKATLTSSNNTVNATPPKDYTTARIDGTLIQQGDTVIQIAAKGLDLGTPDAPQQSDKVQIDSSTWQIVQVGKKYSGVEIAAYVLHLRQ